MSLSVPELLAVAAGHVDAGEFAAGIALCEQLLAADSKNPHALHILGVAARKEKRFAEAAELLERSLSIEPQSAGVQFELGVALIELKEWEQALLHFRKALELNPHFQEACVNICTILERLDRIEEALPWAQRAAEMKPECAIAHFNLGNTFQSVGRVPEAIREFETAYRLKPDFENSRWNCSLARLLSGDFAAGWDLYESRDAAGKVTIDRYQQPRWRGESLAGKTILVHGEQGVGDEILFASCLPDLMAVAGKVVVICEPRLEKLFARSFPTAKVYGVARRHDAAAAQVSESIDFQVPIGSLPRVYRTSREKFPHRWRFLLADTRQQEEWRARFADLGRGLKVGISWRAGGQPIERRKRTTALDQWLPILSMPGVQFVNLQYGETAADLAYAGDQLGIAVHDFPDADPLVDLDAFAAKVSALDLVISVGNATVHLAGALGVPAWAILPMVPAWRWMLTGEQSLWYPSVRTFRQKQRKDWTQVFGEVASALSNRTGRPVVALGDAKGAQSATASTSSQQPTKSEPVACSLNEITETYQSALDAYHRGDNQTATEVCDRILAHAPRNAKALQLRGLLAKAGGQLETAIRMLRLAVQVYSGDAQMHLNLAGTLLEAGQVEEGIASYQRAITISPDVWAMHYELGGILRSAGRRQEAVDSFERAIGVDPQNAKAYNALAGAQMELLDLGAAENTLRRAIALKPDYMAAYNNLGQCLQFAGRLNEAVECYRKAVALDASCTQAVENLRNLEAAIVSAEKPESQPRLTASRWDEISSRAAHCYNEGEMPEACQLAEQLLSNDPQSTVALRILGVAARQSKELDRAFKMLSRAVALKPDDYALHFELGVTLVDMHRTREALEHYLRAVELRPAFHPAYVNISAIHEQQEHYEEVITWTRRALAIKPHCALSHYNLANALREMGRVEEAIESYHRSRAIDPNYVKTSWNLGLSYLLAGDFERGWPLFEQRIEMGEVAVDSYPWPKWDGSSLAGKTILIHGEQGIGDEVLFASCFDEVISQAGKCVIVCEPRLETLFRRSFPAAQVQGYIRRKDGVGARLETQIDVQIPAGSLPLVLRPTADRFPKRDSFLKVDEAKFAFWKDRLNRLGAGLKVGISWRAGGKPQERRKRMIPLELWQGVLTTPGVQFINLQYSDSSGEIAAIGKSLGVAIHDWEEGDPLVDMDGFAARIKALDLVISVGNATVHMAGAVGTPAWTLLPMVPSWRWMVRGEQSPWYRSVQLFRQPSRGDWPSVLESVATRLRRMADAPEEYSKSTQAIAAPAEAEHWYDAKEIITDVMIDSIGTSLAEAEKQLTGGNFAAAEALYREVLQIAPRHIQALQGLGIVARQTGRLDLAIRSFQRSLAMIEGIAAHHCNLASALAAAGRCNEAVPQYLKALEIDPSLTAARIELGVTLQKLGDHERALAEFSRATLAENENPDLLVCRGVSLASQCRIEEAAECFEQALRINPSHLPALGALADLYLDDQQFEDAERCLRRAIILKPEIATWHVQLGRLLQKTGRSDEAVECLEVAVSLAPDELALQAELGSVYRETAQPELAIRCFERAIARKPESHELHNALGLSHSDLGNSEAALVCFDKAVQLQPEYAAAHHNRAFAHLRQANFSAGWQDYAHRWKAHRVAKPVQQDVPEWQGEPLTGKRILIVGEQGVGDEIMFASCYREVVVSAAQVVIVCQPRLEQLMRRSFPQATIFAVTRGQEWRWKLPATCAVDYQIVAGNLPALLRRSNAQFDGSSYLAADPTKVAAWQERFDALGGGLKIGISWRAGTSSLDRRVRGDSLEAWRGLLSLPSARFISLQYGNIGDELQEFRQTTGLEIHHWQSADNTSDLDGLAARMAALDLVISVGNTTVHLAGSLGVPTWALLPQVPGWRWLARNAAADESLWYRSVRLWRQKELGDWGELFGRVRNELLTRPLRRTEESKRGILVAPHFAEVGATNSLVAR